MNLSLPECISLTCHILVKHHLDSGPFGNISIRIPSSDTFWVNREGVTFDQISSSDIIKMNLQGEVIEGRGKPHPGEFIHREIYRERPDIQAIVHTHSPNTVAFSLLGIPIDAFTQLGAAFYQDQGIYQGFTGPVRCSNEGLAIAKALGKHSLVIAKNHGLFACSHSIQAALWDMILADEAAKIHLNALQLGLKAADPLSPECLLKSKIEVRDKQFQFMWESYLESLSLTHFPVEKSPIFTD